MSNPKVGLDSQCLSYLLDGIAGINEPAGNLASEKIALLRSWFYMPRTFFITATVLSEVARIRIIERREFHEGFVRTLFLDYPVRDLNTVQNRALYFETIHHESADCRVLAEAEELGLDIVLSYDHDFVKRLSSASGTVRLMTPTTYWASLNIPKGALPKTVPDPKNPLSQQPWWRW